MSLFRKPIDLLAILQRSLDRALFLYNFIREVIRKFFKMHRSVVRFRFFFRIAKRPIRWLEKVAASGIFRQEKSGLKIYSIKLYGISHKEHDAIRGTLDTTSFQRCEFYSVQPVILLKIRSNSFNTMSVEQRRLINLNLCVPQNS